MPSVARYVTSKFSYKCHMMGVAAGIFPGVGTGKIDNGGRNNRHNISLIHMAKQIHADSLIHGSGRIVPYRSFGHKSYATCIPYIPDCPGCLAYLTKVLTRIQRLY